MPISASRPRTAQQRVDDKRAANPVLDAMFNDGLDNIHHYKTLAQGTLENHEEVRRLWRNFASYQTTYPDLATELEPKIQPIGEGAIKLFLSYLASGSKGQLDKTVTRYAGQFTPPALRSQFVAFLGSDAIDPAGVLSTSSREKPIADAADIDAIIRHVWQDRILFPTNRGKVQFNTVNLISALTSQRPGAIIESGRYRGTNEALHWRDVVFTVIPNAEYPQFPHLAVGLTFRYNKGRRGQSKYYYKYTVLLEPAGERSACLVTNLLYMALEDGIFQDVDSIEEILTPRNHPTSAHTLSVKASCLSQPVCRADVVEDGIYYISLTKALMYARHNSQLHKVTFSMGFEFDFTLYVFRRAAARNFESVLTENNREALMLHTSGSHTFAKSYRSHTYNFDFGGMLHGRGRDPATEALARSASALSTGRDADTPTALDLQDVAALDREPEFVAMRQNISQLRLDADAHILALKVLDDDDPDHDEKHGDLHGRLRSAMKALRDAKSEYAQLRSQEMKIRLLAKRKEWLAGKSRRQLQAGSSRSPLTDKTSQSNRPPVVIAASGKENGEDDVPAGIKTDPTDPESALFEILYHSADPCLATEVISTVNMYAGLPIRRLPQCYPGELPTADEKCPVCKADCRRGAMGAASIGDHIHRCIGKSRVDTAVEELEAEYSPQQCAWAGCKAKAVFGTRAAFVFHLQAHLDEIDTTQDGCQWSIDGRACGDCNDQDWYCHFGSIHDLNVRTDIEVFYCVLCAIWHVDKLGDRSWWDCHLWAHYEERFRPFSTRVDDDDVDAEPIGVEFTDPFDNAVLYDPISGFDGALPEFHGHVVGGVALMAAHCLFCLFNDDLDITLRMKQFLRGDVFIKHLATHRHDIADTDDNLCPVPSCGLRKFNRFDLETHIIAFHRTPLFGTRHRKAVKYLHLPPLPALNPDSVDLDLTHIDSDPMDVDKEPPAPAPKLPKVARDRAAADERRRQAALDAPDKIEGYCCKCGKTFKDIGKHLTGSAVRCREKNEYQLINGTTRAAERLSWTAPVGMTVRPRNKHICGSCRNQCPEILDHVEQCRGSRPPTFFYMLQRGTNGKGKVQRHNGVHHDIAARRQELAAAAASSSKLPSRISGSDDDNDGTEARAAPKKKRKRSHRALAPGSDDDNDGTEARAAPKKKRKPGSDDDNDGTEARAAPKKQRSNKKRQKQQPVASSSKLPDRISSSDEETDDLEARAAALRDKGKRRPISQSAIRLDVSPDPATLPGFLCNGCSQEFTSEGLRDHLTTRTRRSKKCDGQYRTRNLEGKSGHRWSRDIHQWDTDDEN